MSIDLYQKCIVCEGKGIKARQPCPGCVGLGFLPVGLTLAQVEALHDRSKRLRAIEEPDLGLCQHGNEDGAYCRACNEEYKAARLDPENGIEPEEDTTS